MGNCLDPSRRRADQMNPPADDEGRERPRDAEGEGDPGGERGEDDAERDQADQR